MSSTQCLFSSSVYSIKFVNLSLLDNIVEREFSEEVTVLGISRWLSASKPMKQCQCTHLPVLHGSARSRRPF